MLPRVALRGTWAVLFAYGFLTFSPLVYAQHEKADEAVTSTGANLNEMRTAKRWALELRIGAYGPRIDDEFPHLPKNERPHALYFGNRRRPLFQFEIDYQFFQGFGSLGVGYSAGYLRESGRAFVEPQDGQLPSVRSGDETQLTLIPMHLSLVYRFDVLAHRLFVPVVPYAKLGFSYAIWSITGANGHIVDPEGPARGRGGTPGWHGVIGLALLLDVFDPGAAQSLDAESGVNHTYVFFEYGHYAISGLGSTGRMNVSDTTWNAGLLFEF